MELSYKLEKFEGPLGMSYRERLALKHSDPDTYRRLREK